MPKLLETIKNFLRSLHVQDPSPTLDRTHGITDLKGIMIDTFNAMTNPTVSESQNRINIENIELARLKQERDAINSNLKSQHRTMIVTLIATFIALFSSVSAIFIAINQDDPKPPDVNVKAPVVNVAPSQPDVIINVPEPKPE